MASIDSESVERWRARAQEEFNAHTQTKLEVERLRGLLRRVHDALPKSSAFDHLAQEIRRDMA